MKKKIPIAVATLMAIWALASLLFPPKSKSDRLDYDIYGFAKLPVLLDGRIQPIDSTARNAMKVIRHKSTARYAREIGSNEETIPAVEWLLEVGRFAASDGFAATSSSHSTAGMVSSLEPISRA